MISRFTALSIGLLLGLGSVYGITASIDAIAKPTDKLPGKVDDQQLSQLKKGMTEQQVIKALGIPRAKYKSTLLYVRGDATVEIYFSGEKYTRHEITKAG
ncbi:outer membrane protein assembly factor BamE [Leptolyngbya sp. FACHB-36]|uniref:outer membrane protein assembly factor BamE domain-containing protein n=1 Tax=Leptolyngbya sp. FACHB-36 TaxID=2692808 RepID=UPI0016805CDF|nr:outer membrane protein assembly factor BamE [Leptolyngbya sp. FACHB-36]MBD2019252.1 outer membrane protein assembly factor BamE [Leptolyngbya sp. FACHB-36]